MEWPADDVVLISSLEHWSYCPRQCGLIHLEQTFTDNVYTVRGHHAHERTHAEEDRLEGGIRVVRGMPLWSESLGLWGKADVVEFGEDGTPYPVEHKVGQKKGWGHEDIQLGAQALCLEEMLGRPVRLGAVFYRGSQGRREVRIGEELRATVARVTQAVRAMQHGEALPPALNDARCPNCSLFDTCLPSVVARPQRVKLLQAALYRPSQDADGEA